MSRKTTKPEPRSRAFHPAQLAVAAVLILAAGVVLLRRPAVTSVPELADSASGGAGELRRVSPAAALASGMASPELAGKESAPVPTPAPALTPDPSEPEENAKISYHIDKFRAYSTPLDGYKLDNVQLVNDGIILGGAKSEETTATETTFRRGVLESPVITLAHASNAFQPIWRAALPTSDAGIQLELAMSPDGENWSKWFSIQPSGDDISPTYPDGTPNPNYGAVSGTVVCDGVRLYPFMRYRVTLSSTGEEISPVLEELKVTYLDSTAGEGYLAGPGPQPSPEVPPAEAVHPLIGTPATDFGDPALDEGPLPASESASASGAQSPAATPAGPAPGIPGQ